MHISVIATYTILYVCKDLQNLHSWVSQWCDSTGFRRMPNNFVAHFQELLKIIGKGKKDIHKIKIPPKPIAR